MSETPTWPEQVKKVVSDRAYSLNYDDGVQCRFLPVKSEEGSHTIEILMETTHSGDPYDLQWFVKYADDPAAPIRFQLVAPETEGGVLWSDEYQSLDRLREAAQVLPVFIRGYFVGRRSAAAVGAAPAAHG
ncbi:MAG: hypothetical protein EXR95_03580 [Gemmatimonadetes bacterium]|nr:hypothetical protein [Gemmatimonadota bacterium]